MKKSHNKYSPNSEVKKTNANPKRESFKVKESELSPTGSPNNTLRNGIDTQNFANNNFENETDNPQETTTNTVMDLTNKNGSESSDKETQTLLDPEDLLQRVIDLKLDSLTDSGDETNRQLREENAELKSQLEALQERFDKLLTVHKKAKMKEQETSSISAEEVAELYAQLEQAKTKLFHYKDPNRASQKGILKKSVTFNETPEIHHTATDSD